MLGKVNMHLLFCNSKDNFYLSELPTSKNHA